LLLQAFCGTDPSSRPDASGAGAPDAEDYPLPLVLAARKPDTLLLQVSDTPRTRAQAVVARLKRQAVRTPPTGSPGDGTLEEIQPEEDPMARFEDSIEVDVPVRTAYDQWTQFEEFPLFMEGIDRVVQLDDKTLDWTATIAGQKKKWTAEITDQTPDVRVAWKSIRGEVNAGAVLFEPVDARSTRVTLKLDADPMGPVETLGASLGFLERQVKGDLGRFKEFIETRGTPTGAWRGEIHGDEVTEA
jgi:uncharacterized membrane protein